MDDSFATVRKQRRGSRVAGLLCWLYLLALCGLIFYLRTSGDRAWLPTILIFSPRWIFTAPVILLLPTFIYRNCRLPLLVLVIISLFPLMGFCVGWHRFEKADAGQSLRIITFNLHHISFNAPGFKEFLNDAHPDVLAFEEMPGRVNHREFPAGLTHITQHGELCIASRYPIRVASTIAPDIALRYTLETPAGPVDLIGVHLSSPHWALRDSIDGDAEGPDELARNIAARRDEAALLHQEIGKTTDHPLLIAGDFNLAPDSPLFTGNFSTMTDAFQSVGLGFGWTYFHQHTMVRIDHVLVNDLFQVRACSVSPDLGSPHHPVIADLVLRHP